MSITAPGSYRLTGSLMSFATATPVIEITSDDVTLDLNGFTVQGPAVCTGVGAAITCNVARSADAIFSNGARVEIKNGVVTGGTRNGIRSEGPGIRISGVRVIANGYDALALNGGTVEDSVSLRNNGWGTWFTGAPAVFRGNYIADNNGRGIETSVSALVEGNIFSNNSDIGVLVQGGSGIFENTLVNNVSEGVNGFSGTSAFARNVVVGNGATSAGPLVETGSNLCATNTTCP